MNGILLGVDPRDESVPALIRAAGEGARRGLVLRLVVAVPPAHDGLRYDALARQSALRMRAESAIANAEDLVRYLHDGLRIATEGVNGVPDVAVSEEVSRGHPVEQRRTDDPAWADRSRSGTADRPVPAAPPGTGTRPPRRGTLG
ncbi:hypothetical protein [Streptomyces sp. NPDC059491]|uniref:hypothetical protein n=1 Tax=Streptomyces sp. NPDC059491 TaxID=3346850 RepID=UPI0036857093